MASIPLLNTNLLRFRVFTPPGSARGNLHSRQQPSHSWHVWRTIIDEFLNSRELIWCLILRTYRCDIVNPCSATCGQFYLQLLQSLLQPLTQSRTIPVAEPPLPYVAYALWSISVWQLFAGCLSSCTNSLANAGSLVSRVNFPKEALVIAAIGQPLLDFMIRLVLVVSVFVWYQFRLRHR